MDDLRQFLNFLYRGLSGYAYTPIKKQDGTWEQKFFAVPEEAQNLVDWIVTSAQEADVYISPALFNQKSARKECFLSTQVVWVEFDGQDGIDLSAANIPGPHCIVQSSLPGHYHVYWKVGEQLNATLVESINRRLTYALEADSSGWDINQVLRPPGSFNYKRSVPVSLLGIKDEPNRPVDAFDTLPEPAIAVKTFTQDDIPNPQDVWKTGKITEQLHRMITKDDAPKGLRSTFLMHIGYALAEAGLKQEQIISLLLVADDRIQKFYGRTDRLLRIAEIAAIAIFKTQQHRRISGYSISELIKAEINLDVVWGNSETCLLYQGGSGLVAGAPGVGKTQFGLGLSLSVCLGMSFLNGEISKSRRVGYFSMEMGFPSWKKLITRRISKLPSEQLQRLEQNFIQFPVGHRLSRQEIEMAIEEYQLDGVVFDSLSSLTGKLRDDDTMAEFFDWDESIRRSFGCFTWYIHHNRKATGDNKRPKQLDDVYGSFLITARPDSVLGLYRQDSSKPIEYFGLKVRNGETYWNCYLDRTDTLEYIMVDKKNTPLPKVNLIADPKEINVSKPDPNPGSVEPPSSGFKPF